MEGQFSEYIRSVRLKKKITLRQVAEASNIDISLLSKIERGERMGNIEMLPGIAVSLGVSEQRLKAKFLTQKLMHDLKEDSYADEVLGNIVKEIKKAKA